MVNELESQSKVSLELCVVSATLTLASLSSLMLLSLSGPFFSNFTGIYSVLLG